jgi:hypothetical protein
MQYTQHRAIQYLQGQVMPGPEGFSKGQAKHTGTPKTEMLMVLCVC